MNRLLDPPQSRLTQRVTTVERGDRLEHFARLIAIPAYFPSARNIVWLGHERDDLTALQHRADIRFDLLGDRYFVQCKNQIEPLGEAIVEGYVHGFNRRQAVGGFTKLMIVAPGGVTTPARSVLSEVGAVVWTLEDLEAVDVPLADLQAAISTDLPAPPSKHDPVPFRYNQRAIDALVTSQGPRHLVYRATGTGKTIVQAHVIERLKVDRSVVFVPSIELARQNALTYATHLPTHRILVAFSGSLDDSMSSIGVAANTNPDVVAAFLGSPRPSVLVSTYQSVPIAVMPALDTTGYRFDLGIFDEAHRTARPDSSLFNLALSDENVPIRRRDFYTATPRTLDIALKERIADLNEDPESEIRLTPYSMDDSELYGHAIEGTTLTLTQAIAEGAVTTFDVIAGILDEETLRHSVYDLRNGRQVDHYTNIWSGDGDDPSDYVTHGDVAQALFFLKQTERGGSYLTFHNTIERAERMSDLLVALAGDMDIPLRVSSVSGESTRRERRHAVELLDRKDLAAVHVVCNCQLFVEGVNAPALDGVAFFDPRNSTVGIGQAIGRALRKAPGKTRAKVILPVFAPDDRSAEDWVRTSRFGIVYSVSAALRDLDVVLSDIVVEYHATVTSITGHGADRSVGVRVLLPEHYDHERLADRLRSVVLTGRLNAADGRLLAAARAHIDAGGDPEVPFRFVEPTTGYGLGGALNSIRGGSATIEPYTRHELVRLGYRLHPVNRQKPPGDRLVDELTAWIAVGGNPNPPAAARTSAGYTLGTQLANCRSGRIALAEAQWEELEALGTCRHVAGPGRFMYEMERWVAAGGDPNPPQNVQTAWGYRLGAALAEARRPSGRITLSDEQWRRLNDLGVAPAAEGAGRLMYEALRHLHVGAPVDRDTVTTSGYQLGSALAQNRQNWPGYLTPSQWEELAAAGLEVASPWRPSATQRLIYEMDRHLDAGGDPNPTTDFVTSDGYRLGAQLGEARRRDDDQAVPDDVWNRWSKHGVMPAARGGARLVWEVRRHFEAGGTSELRRRDKSAASDYPLGAAMYAAWDGQRILSERQWNELAELGVSRTRPNPKRRPTGPFWDTVLREWKDGTLTAQHLAAARGRRYGTRAGTPPPPQVLDALGPEFPWEPAKKTFWEVLIEAWTAGAATDKQIRSARSRRKHAPNSKEGDGPSPADIEALGPDFPWEPRQARHGDRWYKLARILRTYDGDLLVPYSTTIPDPELNKPYRIGSELSIARRQWDTLTSGQQRALREAGFTPLRERQCAECGQTFPLATTRKRFCSDACYEASVKRATAAHDHTPITCATCGREFVPSHPRQQRCSAPRCRRNQAPLETRPCPHCGRPFEPSHGRLYCSDTCRDARKVQRTRESGRHETRADAAQRLRTGTTARYRLELIEAWDGTPRSKSAWCNLIGNATNPALTRSFQSLIDDGTLVPHDSILGRTRWRLASAQPTQSTGPPATRRADDVVQKLVEAVHAGVLQPGVVPRDLVLNGERLGDVLWRMHRGEVRCTEQHWQQLAAADLRVPDTVTAADLFVTKLREHVESGGGDPSADYVMPDGYQLGSFLVRARRGEVKAMAENHWEQVEALGISRRRQPVGPRR
jgi:superfamily II DNA or RNA helicase